MAETLATRLVNSQVSDGAVQGMWLPEPFFAGPATAGMACAYEWMGKAAHLQSARMGGEFILWLGDATGHLLGDEAYALMRLDECSEELQDDDWRSALTSFYDSLHPKNGGTTARYIDLLKQADASTNVFYVAHHTVVAHHIDDVDKEVWREALIRCLAAVDDTSNFPVQALGVATWSLAKTGALDDTVIDSTEEGSYWSGVPLKDLPALLLSHQIPEGAPFAGGFYWQFDHTAGETDVLVGGWTEDTVYGTLGLVAAAASQEGPPSEGLERAIDAACAALLEGVDAEGRVFEHLSGAGPSYHAYAGELLQALWAVQQHMDARVESAITAELSEY